jgi:hypothetical protein
MPGTETLILKSALFSDKCTAKFDQLAWSVFFSIFQRKKFQEKIGSEIRGRDRRSELRPILNFTPRGKVGPRGEFCPTGVNFVPQGRILSPRAPPFF